MESLDNKVTDVPQNVVEISN